MTSIFVNLPVNDVKKSHTFWSSLGYSTNEQFTDERSTNIVIDENILLMLLERSRFQDFVKGQIAEPTAGTSVINCLSADSREAVDELTDKAMAAGANRWLDPVDLGFMYGRSFQDLDGHVWEVMHMDVAAATQSFEQGALSGAAS